MRNAKSMGRLRHNTVCRETAVIFAKTLPICQFNFICWCEGPLGCCQVDSYTRSKMKEELGSIFFGIKYGCCGNDSPPKDTWGIPASIIDLKPLLCSARWSFYLGKKLKCSTEVVGSISRMCVTNSSSHYNGNVDDWYIVLERRGLPTSVEL